jgi:SAM-dependent methyltransferase
VWDSLAYSPERAIAAARGELEEGGGPAFCQPTSKSATALAKVNPQDDVLEIGCGVARIGAGTGSPLPSLDGCRHLTKHAGVCGGAPADAQQCPPRSTARYHPAWNRGQFLWVVYSTNMFAHIDQMDRWRYVEEAFRVLRPGGRLCIDRGSCCMN